MDSETKLMNEIIHVREKIQITPDEKRIQETIQKSMDTFCFVEQEKRLNDREFLWIQLGLIQKRWWIFQFILLLGLGMLLSVLHTEQLIQRSMGVTASLFVIMIIPELWKNQTCQSMEIEATSYYSLRQIYAARMLLFGIVDILLITVFCGTASITLNITLFKLLVQFVIPMVVTACICFGTLCSKYPFSETVAIILCLIWSAIWMLIILNEKIYAAITFPLWLAFLGIAILFFVFTIYKTLHNCNGFLNRNIFQLN